MTPQTKLFADWFNAKQNRAADSMTVQEWLSTPWHYNSLPLEKHAVMFTDGECYSEGCRRCGRPFFEYKLRYAWTRLSVDGTAGFTQRLWRPDAEYNRVECAPRPFDDPCFWKAPPPDNKTKRSSTEPLHLAADAPNNVGKKGAQKQMNWALYAFQYGPRAQESTLSEEWNARSKKKAESRVLAAAQSGKQAVYRQYGNHCYSAERANAWTKSDQYPIGVACRAAGANARVQAGQQGYRLARCAKYGNLCVDCAATLYAARQLDRSYEGSKYAAKKVKKAKSKQKDERSAAVVLNEWQTRLRAVNTASGDEVEGVLELSADDMRRLKALYQIPLTDTSKEYTRPKHATRPRISAGGEEAAGGAADEAPRLQRGRGALSHNV